MFFEEVTGQQDQKLIKDSADNQFRQNFMWCIYQLFMLISLMRYL